MRHGCYEGEVAVALRNMHLKFARYYGVPHEEFDENEFDGALYPGSIGNWLTKDQQRKFAAQAQCIHPYNTMHLPTKASMLQLCVYAGVVDDVWVYEYMHIRELQSFLATNHRSFSQFLLPTLELFVCSVMCSCVCVF